MWDDFSMSISARTKALTIAGAFIASCLAPTLSVAGVSAAKTPELGIVAAGRIAKEANINGHWTKNFKVIGTYKGVVTVGVAIAKPEQYDTLTFPVTDNLTLNYGYLTWERVESIAFRGLIADVNKALSEMQINTGNVGKNSIKVQVTKGDENKVFSPSNGHFYEYVPSANVTWTDAGTAAAARTFRGVNGYLATITSETENQFVAESIQGASNVWIDGTDKDSEGNWKFTNGPEKDTSFFTLTCATKAAGSADSCTGANSLVSNNNGSTKYSDATVAAVSSQTWSGWETLEPNNWGANENHIATNWKSTRGKWNDLADSTRGISGFVVEYSGVKGGPAPQVYKASSVVKKSKTELYPASVKLTPNKGGYVVQWTKPKNGKPDLYRVTRISRRVSNGRLGRAFTEVCDSKTTKCVDSQPGTTVLGYTVSAYYWKPPVSWNDIKWYSKTAKILR